MIGFMVWVPRFFNRRLGVGGQVIGMIARSPCRVTEESRVLPESWLQVDVRYTADSTPGTGCSATAGGTGPSAAEEPQVMASSAVRNAQRCFMVVP
jgi:hypothetical protein